MAKINFNEDQTYFDINTGEPLSFYWGPDTVDVEGFHFELKKIPLLINNRTKEVFFPERTKAIIKFYASEANKQCESGNPVSGSVICMKDSNVRYPYCGKQDFLYSHVDYEYLPGLQRPWNEGFLTPVFFNIGVLNKYSQNPEYNILIISDTYGRIIYKNHEWAIEFGINSNKNVIMWLGDIENIPDKEKYYLRSENIESDHEIHSEFYNAQINVQIPKPARMSVALQSRRKLQEEIEKKYSIDIFHLDGEISETIINLDRPVYWNEKNIAKPIESMNRIFVESINNKSIKLFLINNEICKLQKKDVDNLGSIKIIELFIKKILKICETEEIMSPFYILYDFRVCTNHLIPDEKKKETLKSIADRLFLKGDRENMEIIYDKIIEKLISSYENILSLL